MPRRPKYDTIDPREKTLKQIQTDLMSASLVAAMAAVPEALGEQVLSALRRVDEALHGHNVLEGRAAGEVALRAWAEYRAQNGLPR